MYTKGPWSIKKRPYGYFTEIYSPCHATLLATTSFYGWTPEEAEANARLIAAAPCLLSLAEKYLALLESDFVGINGRDLSSGRIEEARAIINKAKGE